MDGQVFLIDSGYLNKFMVAIPKNNANGKLNTACLDTSYPGDYSEDLVNLAAYENGEIIIETQDDSKSSAAEEVAAEPNMFVTCVKHEDLQHVDGSQTDSDAPEDADTRPEDEQPYTSASIGFVNNFTNKEKEKHYPTTNVRFRSAPLQIKNKTVYNSFVSKQNNSTDYADERYSLYSDSKNYLRRRMKRDTITMIPPKIFKRQLMDASDTIEPSLKMPATKTGMNYLEWTVTRAFSRPTASACPRLADIFVRNCQTHREPDEQTTDDIGLMPIGFQKTIDKSKIKRITRRRKNPAAKMNIFQKALQNIHQRLPLTEEFIVPHIMETHADEMLLDPQSSEGQLQVYVNSQQEECLFYSGDGEDESQQIILIHDGGISQSEETAEEQVAEGSRNIGVLLAAAAKQQLPSSNFFICRDSSQQEIIVETDENCIQTPHSLFYVENTYPEEVSSS